MGQAMARAARAWGLRKNLSSYLEIVAAAEAPAIVSRETVSARAGRHWTRWELDRLESLRSFEGLSCGEIGRRMGRSEDAVQGQLHRMGLVGPYTRHDWAKPGRRKATEKAGA